MFVTADPAAEHIEEFLAKLYNLYADYVLKNPFYELDMPIRIKLFETHLLRLIHPLLCENCLRLATIS